MAKSKVITRVNPAGRKKIEDEGERKVQVTFYTKKKYIDRNGGDKLVREKCIKLLEKSK